MGTQEDKWQWWWSADGENFHGPVDSREVAYASAVGEECGVCLHPLGFWEMRFEVIEAIKHPVDLAGLFDGDALIGYLIDGPLSDYMGESGEEILDVPPLAEQDLSERLHALISQWQADYNICVVPWTFSETRNRSWWTVPFVETVPS